MNAVDISGLLKEHLAVVKESIDAFKRDLKKVRTGRASAGLLEGIVVDYYGSKTPLSSLAQISTPEARLIQLQIYDSNAVAAIEKAIQTSDLGFNPNTEGNVMRINIPTLTEEGRRDLTKHLHKLAEEFKVSIRNHRRDANDKIKKFEKDGDVTKDEAKRGQDQIQKQTDEHVAQIEQILKAKEAEILEV